MRSAKHWLTAEVCVCRYQGARTYDGFLSFIEEQLENDKVGCGRV